MDDGGPPSGMRTRNCHRGWPYLTQDNHTGFRNNGVSSMCDYSLQFVASRPAMVGDKLVSTKFSNAITGGFSPGGEPNVAVCLLPRTEGAFEKEGEYEHALGFFPNLKPGKKFWGERARFRPGNKDQPH